MKRAVPPFRHCLYLAASSLAMLLVSCGGGGGGAGSGPVATQPGGSSPGPVQAAGAITGYVVDGPVAGASVKLYQLNASGNKTLLGSAVSDGSGAFSIPNGAPANATILLEATGGRFTDEMSRQTVSLGLPLRAVSVSSGAAAHISVSPYSEAEVRVLEHLATPDWSAATVSSTHKLALSEFGNDFLNFTPVNLMAAPPAANVSENDLEMSWFTSGFGAYAHRLDANAATSMNSALEGIRRMLAGEEHDDAVLPAFVGGIVDFINVSAFSDADKAILRTALLVSYRSSTPPAPLSDAQLSKFMPSGVSSGSATAAMPNDAFQLVGTSGTGSMFNYRGALIAYPLNDGSGHWRAPFTASVAEVYGDGDVGIGRWNGGTALDVTRAGTALTSVTEARPLLYGNWHYALARPASNVPVCGTRRLALVAATRPTLASEAVGATVAATGLTADSSVSFQYADKILVGFDIGVIAPDGSVTRFTSSGGIDNPWASHVMIDPQSPVGFMASLQSSGSTTLGATGLRLTGLVSGDGATKLALKLSAGPSLDLTELAAGFAAPAGNLDTTACTNVSADPGTAISPPPANGSYSVLTGFGDHLYYFDPLTVTTFRTRGELSSVLPLQVGADTPIYELAGTADASIGRIDGDFTLGGIVYHRSMSYAVARAGAVVPSTGTRHYVLAAATLVTNDAATLTAGLALGTVQSASLDINFGENPIGTSNASSGTASLHLNGTIGGMPFAIPDSFVASDTSYSRQYNHFGSIGFGYTGTLAAPSGEYAVVRFQTVANSVPLAGTLLFRAQ